MFRSWRPKWHPKHLKTCLLFRYLYPDDCNKMSKTSQLFFFFLILVASDGLYHPLRTNLEEINKCWRSRPLGDDRRLKVIQLFRSQLRFEYRTLKIMVFRQIWYLGVRFLYFYCIIFSHHNPPKDSRLFILFFSLLF